MKLRTLRLLAVLIAITAGCLVVLRLRISWTTGGLPPAQAGVPLAAKGDAEAASRVPEVKLPVPWRAFSGQAPGLAEGELKMVEKAVERYVAEIRAWERAHVERVSLPVSEDAAAGEMMMLVLPPFPKEEAEVAEQRLLVDASALLGRRLSDAEAESVLDEAAGTASPILDCHLALIPSWNAVQRQASWGAIELEDRNDLQIDGKSGRVTLRTTREAYGAVARDGEGFPKRWSHLMALEEVSE